MPHARQLPDCLPACGATLKLFLAPSQQVRLQRRKKIKIKKMRKSHKGAKKNPTRHQSWGLSTLQKYTHHMIKLICKYNCKLKSSQVANLFQKEEKKK